MGWVLRVALCCGLLLLFAAASVTGQGAINGAWRVDGVPRGPWFFEFRGSGATLAGQVRQGVADLYSVSGAVFDGGRISFEVSTADGFHTASLKGTVSGDGINFSRDLKTTAGSTVASGIFDESAPAQFTARRVSSTAQAVQVNGARPMPPPDLRLVMLGTGTPNPDADRSGPALAVIAGPEAYLVDAGPGVVRRAKAAYDRTQIPAIRAIAITHLFLTHLHSDHTLGYPDLIFTPAVVGRAGPLEVYGPKGTEDMTSHIMAEWKKDMDVRINGLEHGRAAAYKVDVHEISPGVVYQDSNVTVRAFLEKHATWDEAFGYRFDADGRRIVISGDTIPTPAVPEACHGCDILAHEVYCMAPGMVASPYYKAAHTSAAELADIATQAKPKLLVLYHQLFNGCTEAELLRQVQQHYAGAVVSAKDLDVY